MRAKVKNQALPEGLCLPVLSLHTWLQETTECSISLQFGDFILKHCSSVATKGTWDEMTRMCVGIRTFRRKWFDFVNQQLSFVKYGDDSEGRIYFLGYTEVEKVLSVLKLMRRLCLWVTPEGHTCLALPALWTLELAHG